MLRPGSRIGTDSGLFPRREAFGPRHSPVTLHQRSQGHSDRVVTQVGAYSPTNHFQKGKHLNEEGKREMSFARADLATPPE